MPTYEYQCEKCNATFEVFQSMKDDRLKVCPRDLCPQAVWGQGTVKRLLGTGAGIIFKGSGFYSTDYRSAGYKEAAKSEKSKASESTAQPAKSSGGETAPATSPAKPASPPPTSSSSQ